MKHHDYLSVLRATLLIAVRDFYVMSNETDSLSENDLLFFWVYIYRVNLIGHGASATLVAQIIATFRTPTEETMRRPLCTFNSRYFIRGLTSGQKLEVFDYKQALGCFDSPLIESHTVRLEGFPQVRTFSKCWFTTYS